MKKLTLLLALFMFVHCIEAAEESVLSKSPDGAFELVQIKETKPDYTHYLLRNTKTKKAVVPDENNDEDYIETGFGSPSIEWNPKNSRLLIISAQIYKRMGSSSSVFRITDDSKLVYVSMPEDAIPDRWNPDGTVVLLVRHEEVYRFDGTKNVLAPVKSQKAGK